MKRNTIMIIDDHPLVRDAWSIILRSTGKYEIVDKIGKSTKIDDLIRIKRPDLVLLDVSVTQQDELKILTTIRKFSPSTKVIAVSLHSETAFVKTMLRNGAKGYVTKNCPADELLQAVDAVLKGNVYVCKELEDLLKQKSTASESLAGFENLTKRELEIIGFLRQGLSSNQIAKKVSIAPKTVKVHRHNILKKLKVKNSNALIEIVNAYGL